MIKVKTFRFPRAGHKYAHINTIVMVKYDNVDIEV